MTDNKQKKREKEKIFFAILFVFFIFCSTFLFLDFFVLDSLETAVWNRQNYLVFFWLSVFFGWVVNKKNRVEKKKGSTWKIFEPTKELLFSFTQKNCVNFTIFFHNFVSFNFFFLGSNYQLSLFWFTALFILLFPFFPFTRGFLFFFVVLFSFAFRLWSFIN